jgi:hypothetical protein
MIRTRAAETDIGIGIPLDRDVYNEKGVLLLRKGYIVQTQTQLTTLIKQGLYFLTKDTSDKSGHVAPKTDELLSFVLVDEAYAALVSLYSCTSANDLPSRILKICDFLNLAVKKDADMALGGILLQKNAKYSIIHQIHCALLCEIILKRLGHTDQERSTVIAAALTMNIGMLGLQDFLFFQHKQPSGDQRKGILNHPYRGVEILRHMGVTDQLWLDAVLQHHELLDGSGYPRGLRADDICRAARLLAIADVYGAKIFPRSYRPPLPANTAARQIFLKEREYIFDSELVDIFVKELGIYHPGCFVRLTNGEIGIITRRGGKIHLPIVHSVVGANGMPLPEPKLRVASSADFTVKELLDTQEGNFDINIYRLWQHDKRLATRET